jgi:hypothetical protein
MLRTSELCSLNQLFCVLQTAVRHAALRLAKFLCLSVSILFASGSLALADSVTLAWDPSSDPSITGYRLHYGVSSGNYTATIDPGNITTATVTQLNAGITYFFVVTAYDGAGVESLPSNEVSLTISVLPPPAFISSMVRGQDGTVQLTLTPAAEPNGPTSAVHVYFSNDLVTWTWMNDVSLGSGAIVVTDPSATSLKQRFYRLSFEQTSSGP